MSFYFSYEGNKQKEINKIMKYVNIEDYETIIEPFGGTLAFSRHIYTLNPNKKIIISDKDEDLTYFCNNFYKNFEENINEAIRIIDTLETKEIFKNYIANVKSEDNIVKYFIYKTHYQIRQGLFPTDGRKPKYLNLKKSGDKLNNFFKKHEYKTEDYKTVLEKYKHDEKALIFLDPPYVGSCGGLYKNKAVIDWEYLREFFSCCSCKFLMVVNYDFFMKLAFSEWWLETYDKKYGRTREDYHAIYSNI